MKKLLILFALITTTSHFAQDKRFTLFARTELSDKNTHNETFDYGFNIGVGINYQMTIMYFEAEVYTFPELNDILYAHIQGTVLGFNHHSRFEDWRVYLGAVKLGLIYREGPHPMFGQDIGVEKYFSNGMFIGVSGGYDIKTDSKLWQEPQHTVWYASLRMGFTL